jgi:hypothetical protein
MAGIEDLKLWRSEPPVGDWLQFNPKHPTLDWRVPYQGRWYTSNLDFVRDWMGSGNIIKELDIKSPIPLSKEFQTYPRHWLSHSSLPEYPPKTITELLDDIKTLKKWVPTEGMGSRLDQLDQSHPFRDLYGKVINNPYDKPLKTKFEYFMRNPNDLKKMISLVPPTEIADKGSVNVWESIMRNLRKPKHGKFLISKYNKSWLENILGLPKKIKYLNQLRKANVPMHSGINWRPAANVGLNTLRSVGLAGDALLGGMAIADILAGTNTIGGMTKNINRMMKVPMDRQGRVIHSVPTYRNLQKAAQRDVLNPNEMRGVTSFDTTKYDPHTMNTGGIVSLVL